MADISFIHLASKDKNVATDKIVSNIRKYYPDAYYMLGSDGVDDLSQIGEKYNCDYIFYDEILGYPIEPYGYRTQKVLKWLDRFHYACYNAKTSHIMMVEDDVWLKKPLTIHDDWEMACHLVGEGNRFPPEVMTMFSNHSGKISKTNFYGGGGGSIYKVSTFLNNYKTVRDWFSSNLEYIQDNYYPTLGWMDCYMVAYYHLCGKEYTVNPHMTDTHHHKNDGFDWEGFVESTSKEIEIVNNYKKYYWV